MTALDSRIRLHRRQLEELERQIASLDALALRLEEEQRRLTARQCEGESTQSLDVAQRGRKLAQSLAEIGEQTARARQAAAAGMAALQRFEALASRRRNPKPVPQRPLHGDRLDELPRSAVG